MKKKVKRETKVKKIIAILITIIFIISISGIIRATQITNPTNINFEDANLYNAIKNTFSARKILHNADNENLSIEVSKDDIEAITELDLSGTKDTKIKDLTGLSSFKNLKELNLSGNAIEEMSSIQETLQLTKLNMTGNTINQEIENTISNMTTLQELNMTNTNMTEANFIKPLISLKTLTLSNNNISNLEIISTLSNITKLDISKNSSFTDFTQIAPLTELRELNVSGTGISTLAGIENISDLEKLYAADNARITTEAGISSIYKTFRTNNQEIVYLKSLKILNLSNLGISGTRPRIAFNNFSKLTALEELHLASNEISDLSNVAKLTNLKYLDLANNKIDSKDLANIVQYKTENGQKVIEAENTLKATKLDLKKNDIIDIAIFAEYPANIEYLDLSENHIYDITALAKHTFSNALYLQKQNITFGIYEKKVEVAHYIILPDIFQKSKIKDSLVYSENIKFNLEGVTLNQNYLKENQYNIIIDSTKTKEDKLSVTLSGGVANGSVVNFQIGTKTGAHIDSLIESLVFIDENLDLAISNDITTRYADQIKYFARVPKIININQDVISRIADFNLQHTDKDEKTKIKDLTGIENFYNLQTLHLQGNNITTIKQLEGCTKLQTLSLANNPNLGNNNEIIEKLTKLIDLDLSNTGLTHIDSINNLTNTYTSKNKKTIMTILNISENNLANIDGIEAITTLQKLYIANIGLKDENIQKLGTLKNLVTLNISGNEIENIEVLSNFQNLQYLYLNKNKVESLEPIQGIIFEELEFSENRVKDITPLDSHHTINNLKMDNNKIENVEILSDILITEEQELSLTGQKMVRVLEQGTTGNIEIELPQIFKAAKESGNKIYTYTDLVVSDCTLDSTGKKVIVNVEQLGDKIAQVSINGGKANGTILSIAAPLKATVAYTPSNETKTNKDITAKITFNRTNVTITNNEGKSTYKFTENGEFTFEYTDIYGFEGKTVAKVNNIDKKAPEIKDTIRKIENKKITVTIKVNEPIIAPSTWTLSQNKLSITKTFDKDVNEKIKIVDEAGNSKVVDIQIKIDKKAPKISGIENGKKYNNSVTPIIEDENLDKVMLMKDEKQVAGYKSGDTIEEEGNYIITAVDKFENETKVTFEIRISDIIASDKYSVNEENKIISKIFPKTTAETLKLKLNAEMEYKILDKSGKEILNTAKIGTASQIKMNSGKIYKLIVTGDANGDGLADFKDMTKMNSHRLNKNKLDGEFLQAADINGDGVVDLKDLSRLNRYRLGKSAEL